MLSFFIFNVAPQKKREPGGIFGGDTEKGVRSVGNLAILAYPK
jgi:hypothetical protein